MHITEGIITGAPALLYTAAGMGLVGYGTARMKKFVAVYPEKRPLLGMAGAIIFFVSLLPLPAFTGTSTHPCGTPLIAILFGPAVAIALTGASLLLQAAFFAHGGFGTWGANVIALGLFGCLTGWGVFHVSRKAGFSLWAAGFAGGLAGDLAVYLGSGIILAGALTNAPTPQYSFAGYLAVIFAAYLPVQVPIAVAEMVVTGLALHYIYKQRPEVLTELGVIKYGPGRNKSTRSTALVLFMVASLAVLPFIDATAEEHRSDTIPRETARPHSGISDPASFAGMDETVNEKLAEDAGQPPRSPFLNTESMGDLWNALLLLAGAVCGFIVGRWWHLISSPQHRNKR